MKTIAILLISLLSITVSSCNDDTSAAKITRESLSDNSDNYYTYNTSDNFDNSDNSEIDDPEISKYYDLWVDDANDSEDGVSGLKSESDAASPVKDSDSAAAQAPAQTSAPPAAQAPAAAQAPTAAPQGETVYVTPSGKKYHKANCRTMRGSSQAIDINYAISKGYEPCSVCHR